MSKPLANLFDDETRRRMADLYGKPVRLAAPSADAYKAQLQAWCDLADKQYTPEELAAARAALDVPANCAQSELTMRNTP